MCAYVAGIDAKDVESDGGDRGADCIEDFVAPQIGESFIFEVIVGVYRPGRIIFWIGHEAADGEGPVADWV